MGSNTAGFQNEYNLIEYLNNKTLNELNNNMRNFILFLYPNITIDDKIIARSGKKGQKPDLEIIVDNNIKRVSVKKGNGNSVHQENVNLFMDFLVSLNIDENVKIELLKYHWSDGTTDGSGKIRVSSANYKKSNKMQIEKINYELNKPQILNKIIERLLFQGKSSEYDRADYVYHGTIENGKWASAEEIIKYICNNDFNSNSVHFGPLSYQIWNSCLNWNPKMENRRNVMQSKWGSLLSDLIKIESERINNE